MSRNHIFIFLVFLFLRSALPVSGAPGDLDTTFDQDGVATTTIPNSTFAAFPDIVVQPDGKLVISFSANGGTGFDMLLARYNPDGTLDTTFSGDGIVTSPFGLDFDSARALALQPDGKIVVAGSAGVSGALFAVARFNPNGTLDTNFGQNGTVTTPILFSAIAGAVAIQSDGKIVVGGGAFNSSNQDFFVVARYNANGTVDTSFGNSGTVMADFGVIDFFSDLLIQPDGKIIAAGTGNVSSSTPSLAMMRLNTNGTFDSTFDGDGIVASQISGFEEVNSIDLQPDGKIVAGALIASSFAVVRYNANGSPDNTFDGDSVALADFGDLSRASDVRVLGDGKLAGVGDVAGSGDDFAIARFNSNGSLDQTFGEGGKQTTSVSNEDDTLSRLAVQPDGKLVGVGISGVTGAKKATIARYLVADGRRPRADFDGDRKTDISVFRPSDGNWYIDRSTAGFTGVHWGLAGDRLIPGDFDGDGKTDTAVFRPSAVGGEIDFHILNSSGSIYTGVSWGLPADIPVIGDFDGDGRDDTGVFRPSDGTWYVLGSTGSMSFIPFGMEGDLPITGDFDGDGVSDRTVFRDRYWLTLRSSGGVMLTEFGLPTDIPVPADYDGDGKQDIAVFRPSAGDWYWLKSGNGAFDAVHWGASGDIPAPGDYDGDGKDDQAVYRNGAWYLNRSTAGFAAAAFGLTTDRPVPRAYFP